MSTYIQNIEEIQFGIMSPDMIRRMSAVEVTSNKLGGMGMVNSVYDVRMGPMYSDQECVTCRASIKDCPGHFGHIELNTSIIHPLYYKHVLSFLKCFCFECSRLLITHEHLELWGISKLRDSVRFNHILERLVKLRICVHCNQLQPNYIYSTVDSQFVAVHKYGATTERLCMSTLDIQKIFDSIVDEDIQTLGMNPALMKPKHLLLTVLPVIPPRSRPFIVTEHMVCDDDMTIQLCEIIKLNNYLLDETLQPTKRSKYIQSLQFRIKTLFDNSKGTAKHTNSRQLKGIKERITGKDGLIRMNLLGKRCNQTARTVIGPDPTLRVNEIAIPHEIADTLSYPEHVTEFNKNYLYSLIETGKVDTIIRNDRRFYLKYLTQSNVPFELQIGDVVERKVKDGDILLLNRQPTLHLSSMLAMRVIRRTGKTIRMNLAITSCFNADFDGDEMNLHIPASETTRTELEYLSTPEANFIDTQASKPIMSIVQDCLLGAFLLTKTNDPIPKHTFQNIFMKLENVDYFSKLSHVQKTYKKLGVSIPLYSGKTLFSFLLPSDFNYTSKNSAVTDAPILKIKAGVLYEGAVNKKNLGGTQHSIQRLLYKEYPEQVCLDFVNNVQWLANEFLLYRGFTVGIGDCIATKTDEIQSVIARCFTEAEGIEDVTSNSFIREAKVIMALNKAKDVGMKIARDAFSKDNNFLDTVQSGSKGGYFNIAQITGLLGQQNIAGARVQPQLNQGRRTLPHYPFTDVPKADEYASKGFISNSFFHGLSPNDFWVHAMSGRVGILDTAMKTASSGYTQRKMVKVMEDLQVKYDQTVRNSVGSIIQFAYGSDNLCGTQTIIEDGMSQIVDLDRLVDQVNTRFEYK